MTTITWLPHPRSTPSSARLLRQSSGRAYSHRPLQGRHPALQRQLLLSQRMIKPHLPYLRTPNRRPHRRVPPTRVKIAPLQRMHLSCRWIALIVAHTLIGPNQGSCATTRSAPGGSAPRAYLQQSEPTLWIAVITVASLRHIVLAGQNRNDPSREGSALSWLSSVYFPPRITRIQ